MRDGELTGQRNAVLVSHLDRCTPCRRAFERLRDSVEGRPEAIPDGGLLTQMCAALHLWEEQSREGAAKGRVATRIAPFLGSAATDKILQPVPDSGENLLSTVEPVLALFLGNRAAAHLVNRVVDTALLRA